ncbi:maleylpyruvate isomerase N-terminal domain-containing protein [Knoellia aerolata]|uniref:maleylpyruvate isomerase N-terminal domain-containing protein n=1 Tax=Knoellia aerolata TaxID=442954 RepID=UPI0009FDE573|nr:maleylpyruvate isomerase N-terminal domain-containing protein [Knoellia aerolata]
MGREGTTWVAKERRSFAASFRDIDPDAPTLCDGWTTRHLLAHVGQREHAILRNIWDQVTTKSPGEERFMRSLVTKASSPTDMPPWSTRWRQDNPDTR